VKATLSYLLAFHACSAFTADCSDPRQHRVYLAQSDDGVAWDLLPGWQPFQGSVPDVVRRGNVVYVYTGPTLVRLDLSTGQQSTPQSVQIRTSDGGSADVMPTDVSLVLDDEGRLVLFFLFGSPGSDPAMCPPGEAACTKRIGSATESEGSDGAAFVLDNGDRLSVSIGAGTPFQSASDPDAWSDGRDYYLLLSHGPWMTLWMSDRLHGEYRQLDVPPMGFLSAGSGGVGAGFFEPHTGAPWIYAHIRQQVGMVIRRAAPKDLSRQLEESDWMTVLTGDGLGFEPGTNVESPGFAVNQP
jgi:hypothetical protein